MPPARTAAGAGSAKRLRRKLGLVLPGLLHSQEMLLAQPRIRELYPEYLFTAHCIVRATVPLMEVARNRAETLPESDRVATPLARYLGEHIVEEMHHDEWVLEDLEAVGGNRKAFLARPPSPTVAGFVGSQYYWILHYHPVAVMGYIAILEGYPPSTSLIDELRTRTGYGPEAFRTLMAHGELDEDHRQHFNATLDGLPLTREQETVIGINALQGVHLLSRALAEIVDRADGAGRR